VEGKKSKAVRRKRI